MNFEVAGYSHIGRRDQNEDNRCIVENGNQIAVIVADGLGGLNFGEVASQKAVDFISDFLRDKVVNEDDLIDAIQFASDEIYAIQQKDKPMSTTASVLWISDEEAWAGYVGDSRIYQIRNGKIIYQSVDHSAAQMNVLVGKLKQSEIRQSKDRNRLVRVLGDFDAPMVDTQELTVKPGDCFLLCTDGFWEPVTEEAMLDALQYSSNPHQWLRHMRQIIEDVDDPTQDNNTAVCVWVI